MGGCCGTTPEHLRLLVTQVGGKPHPVRPQDSVPQLASAIQAQSMMQEPRPFLIGERLNTQGSHKFKQFIMDEDYDSVLEIASRQIE